MLLVVCFDDIISTTPIKNKNSENDETIKNKMDFVDDRRDKPRIQVERAILDLSITEMQSGREEVVVFVNKIDSPSTCV